VDDPAIVMDAAASFLAFRPRTVEETRRSLRHLGYRSTLVDRALGRLTELGYLDDAAYARAFVEARDRSRPRGELALRRELMRHGVSGEVIDAVLGARRLEAEGPVGDAGEPSKGSADLAAARRLLERRRASLEREPDRRRRRQRAYAILARNGFDPETCALAVSDAVGRAADPEDEADQADEP
jgi:regulatory protein